MPDGPVPPPKRPCPICGGETVQRFRPFCSRRCAQIDLSRWLGGHYAIPTIDDPYSDEPNDDEN